MAVSVPIQRTSAPSNYLDDPWDDETLSLWARRLFWFFGLTLGLIETAASRFSMNVDGISYLDLGHAYLSRDWNAAINGYWSPLYALLIGGAVGLVNVSPYWESTITHAVNFLIFVASMAAFEFFLSGLCQRTQALRPPTESLEPLPVWSLRAFGYALFLYAGLVWISIWSVTPDQCVAVVMYLVAGVLLRMQNPTTGWAQNVILGILLGVGYLTKAALFPLGLISLFAALFLPSQERFGKRLARAIVTAAIFALIGSPLVIALSRAKGRLTFGDAGKLAYAEMVDHLTRYGQWQGEGNVGVPTHPVRMPLANPHVYEFAAPVGGTYPPWYDASYWLEGAKTHLDVREQFRVLAASARAYIRCAIEIAGFILACVVLFSLNRKSYSFWRGLAATWPGWLAALAGIGMFSLVLVETRYVASFIVILGLSCLGGFRLLPGARTRRIVIGLAAGVAALSLLATANVAKRNLYSSTLKPRHRQWEIAQMLMQRGITPGDTVATIIDHREGDYWAHLANLKIVEEIPLEEMPEVASLDEESRTDLVRVLREPGAKAIITSPAPPAGTGFHWERLGDSEYYISSLMQEGRN